MQVIGDTLHVFFYGDTAVRIGCKLDAATTPMVRTRLWTP
jgi:hypothetical protein